MAGRHEELLHRAWRSAASRDSLVATRDGDLFRVIYPGRPSDGAGPDFRDAVLQTSRGTLLKGDVEIHMRTSGWRDHGHQLDDRYNGVVFHVVSEGDSQATSAARRTLPLVVLGRGRALERILPANPHDAEVPDNGDCAARSAPGPALNVPDMLLAGLLPRMSLGEAGDRRFLARSSGYQVALRGTPPDDVMWSAVLEGLGYARNQRGFRQLAARLPWTALAAAPGGSALAPADLEMVLLRAAGLATRPPASTPPGSFLCSLGPLRGSAPTWVRSAGRPRNHPARRIAAASRLAHRWLASGGPVAALESTVKAAVSHRDAYRALIVPGSGAEAGSLGPGRAAAIVVSAILPCLHANAVHAGRWHVAERCLALFQGHPGLPPNAVEREARSILSRTGQHEPARTAREQQGLLYLYRSLTMS
jgi:hypothetical protein